MNALRLSVLFLLLGGTACVAVDEQTEGIPLSAISDHRPSWHEVPDDGILREQVTPEMELAREAQECERWNLLHPAEEPRLPYVTQLLQDAPGPVIAATDYVRSFADQIFRTLFPTHGEHCAQCAGAAIIVE